MLNVYKKDEDRTFNLKEANYDVVVVGAGIAGISAALQSARKGIKTALVTDRPILGGSASSEVRVGPGGADNPPWNRFARETGIIEEIFNHIHYRASLSGKWRWFYFDQIYFDLVLKEPNLTCYLNTTIYKVYKDNASNKIQSVEGIQLRAENKIKLNGKVFIDCSGDGTVGYLAGADYRVGREAKSEFQETYAPEKEDKKTMGATLLFTSVDTGHPVKFTCPEWAIKIDKLPSYRRLSRSIRPMPDGTYYGFWWVEYGGDIDSIHDDDEVIWTLRKLVYGIWDYIKNSGNFNDVENQEINWIGYLPGKRESRRLMGPYIANSNDFLNQKQFEDVIGYTGWPIDIHPPKGFMTNEPGCTHDYLPGITDIPFRCIYSRNVCNLLFAGRNISATHEGLGTLRVIPTTAVMGQAAGEAATICIEKDVFPDDIYKSSLYLNELKRRLVRSDQSIIGYRLLEDDDYSRNAIIKASSVRKMSLTNIESFKYLDTTYGIILPIETDKLRSISFYLSSEKQEKVDISIYSSDDKPQNYRINKLLYSNSLVVNKADWYTINTNVSIGEGKKVFVFVHKNPRVKLYFSYSELPGVLGIMVKDEPIYGFNTRYYLTNNSHRQFTPCFTVTPEQNVYEPENINNGYTRPYGLPYLWSSDKLDITKGGEWIELKFTEEKTISNIELVFNSELNAKRLKPTINKVYPQLVKDYDIIALTNQGEKLIVKERNNFVRFKKHSFETIKANAIKVVVYNTWGSPYVEIFDIRIY